MLNLIYAQEPINIVGKSLFLAGPTPRDEETKSWRPEAIEIISNLPNLNFETIFIPEGKDHSWKEHYDDQVDWEWQALQLSSVILFWVPREIKSMPAFTTNVEFGMFLNSRKIVLGFPFKASKMRYLEWHAHRLQVPISHRLEDTIVLANQMAIRPTTYIKQSGEHSVINMCNPYKLI